MILLNNRDINSESPCIGVCKLDSRGICEGCKRTSKQIRDWWDFTDEEKTTINKSLKINKDIEQVRWNMKRGLKKSSFFYIFTSFFICSYK